METPAPGRSRIEQLNHASRLTMRAALVGLAALVLSYAGQLGLAMSPWNAIALPAGLAIGAGWRWGRWMLPAAAAGVALALLGTGAPWGAAGLAAVIVGGAPLLVNLLLQQFGFDAHLERPIDLLLVATVVPLAGALPSALLAASWATAATGRSPLVSVVTGFFILGVGMVGVALATLAADRSALQHLQPGAPRRAAALGVLSVLAMLALLALAPMARSPVAALALFAPHVVLAALALRGQLVIAAAGLILAGLMGAGQARTGLSLWSTDGSVQAALAAWIGSALAVLLLCHAARVDWRGRSQRWEWALDGSRLGVADWHLQRNENFASGAWRTLTGHGDRQWTPQLWQQQVHADDRPRLAEAIASLASGAAGRGQFELRMADASGWRWLEATLMVIERDGSGEPVRLLATLADAHERHVAQERQLMSVSLFQHLHEGLLITDADLRALDANPAYTQILGVPREELLGSVPSLLRPAPADPVARQQRAAMWAGLRDNGSWRGELLERRRSGEFCTLQATISTVLGPQLDLRYHVLVISDITQQQQQREQLERQAHFDELTRLPNRARLSQLLDDAMRAADRDGYLLVVCYLDLDRFKPVNDRFGHAAGDRLLAELAGRMRSALRSRDSWADTAARLGGDEFVLLLRAGTLEEARLAVDRVLRVVCQPYVVDPEHDPVQVTASMGATIYPLDRSDADTLLRHADHAMYGAKQAGRNCCHFFDPEHRRRNEERVMAIGRVQEALDKQEFVLFYQPKVDMKSGLVLGFEALLRWDHPQHGLVAPMQFLPLIEHTGLSSRIGDWVLAQALEHLSQWRRNGLDISVSVNISARHLQEPDFALRLSELLARHEDPLAEHLELEMLETAAHEDIDATSALVARCQSIGVRFALDDFGTGYSTLTYLKRLPVDVLKIDRSFVHHMLDDAQDRAIVEGVIGLARTFGCTVVAEGVESPAQARTLLDLGCQIGQGTGIAAPMPSALVAGWVHDYRGVFTLAPAAGAEPGAAARA
ncbi:Diguanylate cyclase [Rubrivivax sp. A210]|uniref:GGDEF domain-containing phosphodiesterase n=1 Tax=Rubrivivax sp. A210 TaxID=2772301 RepID=UPI00191B02B0|nr:GGDEF domain-containing phosphodiesterase [Rubrivivax sp. A210]CAD5367218.1 Diguanylate cyclase [Rubrivivax sp. A210]